MPFSMGRYPHVVVVKGKVYIGGGLAYMEMQTVMVCDPQRDVWHTLPPYMYTSFAMAVVNDQLVLVGGIDVKTRKCIAMLGVWSEQSQTWTNPFPPMPTARRSPSAVTHDNRWLVVVGGKSEDAVTSVEILDTTLGQWYHGAPIPQPCYHVSAATVGNMCYVLGGFTKGGLSSKNVFSLCLDYLISQAVPQPVSVTTLPTQSTSRPPHTPPTLLMSPWQTIPDTPLKRSSALALNGALLAVGGEERVSMNKAIHLYQPCLLYTSPSPRDATLSRMPSSA